MNTQEAVQLIDAIDTIAKATGETFCGITSRIVFFDKRIERMITEAADIHEAVTETAARIGTASA